MSNIWFSADFHAFHKNICEGTSNWSDKRGCRKFSTPEVMTSTMARNINEVVKKDDILYFLGDWSFGGIKNIAIFRRMINCENIHLILGNHDHHIAKNKPIHGIYKSDKEAPFAFLADSPVNCMTQELFTSVSYYKEIKIDRTLIILSHYAYRVWNESHKGSWMLFGHSHGSMPEYVQRTETVTVDVNGGKSRVLNNVLARTMDVGIDTHPEFRPYSFEEIGSIFKDRPPLTIDHHKN